MNVMIRGVTLLLATAILLCLFLCASAMAGLLDDYDNQVIALMKSDVGRKVWISNRGNQGLLLCATRKQNGCPRISHTSIIIKSIVAAPRKP
jgi:hypothetical protein